MTSHRSFRLLLVLAAGCIGSPASAGVIRHDRDDSDYLTLDDQFPGVGKFLGTNQTGDVIILGSGVLIAPNWVLTAAHLWNNASLTSLHFRLVDDASADPTESNWYTAQSWVAHPQFDQTVWWSGYDLGLVRFAEDLTLPDDVNLAGYRPAERYTGSDEVGQTGISVGYGRTGTGDSSNRTQDYQRRAGENSIDSLLDLGIYGDLDKWLGRFGPPGQQYPNQRMLMSDFDNPTKADEGDDSDNTIRSSSYVPLDLEYLIFRGDSGGGLFIGDKLAGIHWGGFYGGYPPDGLPFDSDYGDLSFHTRVSVLNDWINSQIPEPSSIIVWSLLVASSITAGWRQRRRARGLGKAGA